VKQNEITKANKKQLFYRMAILWEQEKLNQNVKTLLLG
jgi:hypothetical protein